MKHQKKLNEVKPLACPICHSAMMLNEKMCDDCTKALHELILGKRKNKCKCTTKKK